jgi:hypothetical protein
MNMDVIADVSEVYVCSIFMVEISSFGYSSTLFFRSRKLYIHEITHSIDFDHEERGNMYFRNVANTSYI